jgi:hypothetical protein
LVPRPFINGDGWATSALTIRSALHTDTFSRHERRSLAITHSGAFAVWSGLFSSFDCTYSHLRGRHDAWNSVAAGASTGGLLAVRAGWKACAKNAAIGGVLLGMIEGVSVLAQKMLAPPQMDELALGNDASGGATAEQKQKAEAAAAAAAARETDGGAGVTGDVISKQLGSLNDALIADDAGTSTFADNAGANAWATQSYDGDGSSSGNDDYGAAASHPLLAKQRTDEAAYSSTPVSASDNVGFSMPDEDDAFDFDPAAASMMSDDDAPAPAKKSGWFS